MEIFIKTRTKLYYAIPALLITIAVFFIIFSFGVPKKQVNLLGLNISSQDAKDYVSSKVCSSRNLREIFPVFAQKRESEVFEIKDKDTDIKTGYVVSFEGGFMATSAISELRPVIAYSDKTFNPESLDAEPGDECFNPLIDIIMNDLKLMNEAYENGEVPEEVIKENSKNWNNTIQNKDINIKEEKNKSYSFESSKNYAWADDADIVRYWPPLGTTATGGWVETLWHQSAPFDGFCPMDNNRGERCSVGCGAIAVAQVLNYHKSVGMVSFGSIDRYISSWKRNTVRIDQDSEINDFPSFDELNVFLDEIKQVYEDGSALAMDDPSHEDLLAALSFAVGIAFHTGYSGLGSTSGMNAYPFRTKFGYNAQNMSGDDRNLLSVLSENMREEKPAVLLILGRAGGHYVVCDGYNTDEFYHINCGWGDSGSGWYSLPDELPHIYTMLSFCVLNIEPMDSFGTINGTVTNESGNLSNAVIELMRDYAYYGLTASDEDGSYILSAGADTYNIKCWSTPFKTLLAAGAGEISVGDGETVTRNFHFPQSNNFRVIDNSCILAFDPSAFFPKACDNISWADYDNDNDLDVFFPNSWGQNIFCRNNGDGTFSKIEDREILNTGHSNGASWGDHNNDGFVDLFIANGNGQNNCLFQNNRNGTFTKILEGSIVSDGGNSRSAYWGDYDNDGFLDLFVCNGDAQKETAHSVRSWKVVLLMTEAGQTALSGLIMTGIMTLICM